MKATINKDKFSKALSYTTKAVSTKPNIPVLANVLIQADKNGISLSATNLDMGINMWIPCKVDVDGETTVSAKFIADFVSAVNGNNVDIELDSNSLKISAAAAKAKFNTIPSSEFPVMPKVSEVEILRVKAESLISAMEKVVFACSTDMSAGKIQQTGVFFEIDRAKKSISFVGLDSFRLSIASIGAQEIAEEIPRDEIIVPAKHMQEVCRILQDIGTVDEVSVFLSESRSQIVFRFSDVEFSVRLLEGPYPDYKRILPEDNAFSFDVKKSDLEQAVKVANTFAKGISGNKTNFDLDKERSLVSISSMVAEVGENDAEITVENIEAPSDLKLAYNLKYLQDLVSHVSGEKIRFETKSQYSPSVFHDSGDKSFLHIIMPLRRD